MDTGNTLTVSGTKFDYYEYGSRSVVKPCRGTKAPKAFGGVANGRNKDRGSGKGRDS
jgi:hypothetical protein